MKLDVTFKSDIAPTELQKVCIVFCWLQSCATVQYPNLNVMCQLAFLRFTEWDAYISAGQISRRVISVIARAAA